MRRALGRVVLLTAVGAVGLFATGGAVLSATPQTPGPEPGSAEQMEYFADTCRHEMQRPPIGGVENVTTPGPGPIVAGDVVDIDPVGTRPIGPTPGSRRSSTASRSTAGRTGPSDEERPAPNDGAYARELVVPEDMEGGHLLCQQGFVYGMFARGGYTLTSSPRVCFTTEAAPPPPTTTTTEPPTTTTTTAAPTTTTTAAPAPRVAAAEPGVAPAPAPVPIRTLPRTGPHDRLLLLSAGGALAAGGLAVAAGARRRRAFQG